MNKKSISTWWKRLLDKIGCVIGPGYSCYVCGMELEHPEYPVCERCQPEMERTGNNVCKKCGEPIAEDNDYCLDCKGKDRVFDCAKSCFVYNDASGKIVSDLKYNKHKYIAKFFAEEMYNKLKEFGTMPDIIVPVPITSKRFKQRGFNQSELIAEELSKLSDNKLIVRTDLVVRDVDRLPQAGLDRSARIVNLKGVFSVNGNEKLSGKTVVVIDDVFTTGSTISEVVLQLRKLKPKKIYALTFAKTPANKIG